MRFIQTAVKIAKIASECRISHSIGFGGRRKSIEAWGKWPETDMIEVMYGRDRDNDSTEQPDHPEAKRSDILPDTGEKVFAFC